MALFDSLNLIHWSFFLSSHPSTNHAEKFLFCPVERYPQCQDLPHSKLTRVIPPDVSTLPDCSSRWRWRSPGWSYPPWPFPYGSSLRKIPPSAALCSFFAFPHQFSFLALIPSTRFRSNPSTSSLNLGNRIPQVCLRGLSTFFTLLLIFRIT